MGVKAGVALADLNVPWLCSWHHTARPGLFPSFDDLGEGMKFQGTKVSLGLVLSGALLLGACTSPEPTDPEDAASGR